MPSEAKWDISFLAGGGLLWIGWRLYFVLVTMHVAICLILISVILLQSGEAADLAGAFGGSGSQSAFGPRGAATFLSRATTWCAVMFMFTSDAADGACGHHNGVVRTLRARAVLEVGAEVSARSAGGASLAGDPRSARRAAPAPVQSAPPVRPTQPALPSAPPTPGASWTGNAVTRRVSFGYSLFSSSCGRGGTGRRTSLRGWR